VPSQKIFLSVKLVSIANVCSNCRTDINPALISAPYRLAETDTMLDHCRNRAHRVRRFYGNAALRAGFRHVTL